MERVGMVRCLKMALFRRNQSMWGFGSPGVRLLLALALAGGLMSARATSFYERRCTEVVQSTHGVVRGKVGTTYTNWVTGLDSVKRVYTYYELTVDEAFKGSVNGPSLVFRQLGGEKDGVGLE